MAVVNTAKKKFQDGDIDLLVDTIKCMILTSTHVTNIDTQEFISDVSANEITDSTGDYTAGGEILGTKTTTVDTGNDWSVFDAADINLTNTTITNAKFYVIYKDTGTPATSPIIAIIDEGTARTSSAGAFDIAWSTNGILRFA